MIVTTALKQEELLEEKARNVSNDLQTPYIPRKKQSLSRLQMKYKTDILIVGQDRYDYYPFGSNEAIFFHPNVAMLRYKRLLKGEEDPFITATKLTKGMSLLDCTLGLASDAIIASYVTSTNGKVTGIEAHRVLAYIVQHGLVTSMLEDKIWNEALQRIEVIADEHLSFLKRCKDNSYDVVYFDPMFEQAIDESKGIEPLRQIARYEEISEETIAEAFRVAKKRVVLKDHWQSNRFQQFGFQVIKRPTAKFHFGYIEKC